MAQISVDKFLFDIKEEEEKKNEENSLLSN